MVMAPLRLGVVGCGSITERGLLPHLSMADAQKVARVVALCSPTVARVESLSGRYGVDHVFTALEDMLAWDGLDAVLVATPIPLHYEHVKACLGAGIHVHVQKTLAQTHSEGRELLQLAQANGLTLAASPGQTLLPAYRQARQLIHDGTLGQPYAAWGMNVAAGHERDPLVKDPSWYYRPGGGPLEDMGIYTIHTLIDLLGCPQRVAAMSGRPMAQKPWGNTTIAVQTDDNVGLLLDFGGGVLGTVYTAFASEPELLRWGHLAMVGSEGSIEVCRSPTTRGQFELVHRWATGSAKSLLGHGLEGDHEVMDEAHIYLDILDFVDALAQGRPPEASADTACTALAVIEAARASASAGRSLPVSAV